MPISWQIPNSDRSFQLAQDKKGVPLIEVAKGSRPHQVFLEMARTLRPIAVDEPAKPSEGPVRGFVLIECRYCRCT